MKRIIMPFAALAILASACTSLEPLTKIEGLDITDYSAAVMGGETSASAEVELNQNYQATVISLDASAVTAALGAKKLPADLVLGAFTADGKFICGPRNYTSLRGFYFDLDGYACSPSDKNVRFYVDAGVSSALTLSLALVPDACVSGDSFVAHLGLANESVSCKLDLSVEAVGTTAWADYTVSEDGLTYNIKEKVKNDYSALDVAIDEAALCAALGISGISELTSGLGGQNPAFTYAGVNADGSAAPNTTANGYGCWYDINGDVCSWRADGWFCFAEWGGESPMVYKVGQATSDVEPGMSATVRNRFTNVSTGASVDLTFNVEIVSKL